jgi:Zn-dependent peptidase ImmA (M78 family)/O-acetyl-ADP-ribose deacetylase (regulator of RNase III)
MKDSQKKKSKASEQERAMMDALLGSDDDFASDECSEEFLEAIDIDPSGLTAEFVSRLEKESLEFSGEEDEPLRVQAALRSIRAQMGKANKFETSRSDTRRMLLTSAKSGYWTNRSVFTLAQEGPPVEGITQRARTAIREFTDAGNVVPPLDPFALAEFRKIKVVPREDIRDARTRFVDGRFVIEFNPNRPRGRVRYSICHELTHTFFPDCSEAIRNRSTHEEMESDEWQLEMLCNIGAGELLMPFVTLPDFDQETLSIQKLMEMRQDYDVSTEALLLRIARTTTVQCCVFSASRKDNSEGFQIDYAKPSHSWKVPIQSGLKLPKTSVIRHCTAIGYSDKGIEQWLTSLGDTRVECVGVPPYPNQTYPRVMGFIAPTQASSDEGNRIQYKGGDATDPRQTGGYRIIAHLVNDKTPTWGGAFARAVKKKWGAAQTDFQQWVESNKANLTLGNLRVVEVMDNLAVATMVAQHGYGESAKPRIRYGALKAALDELAEVAAHHEASIHMPKIGSGQARGNWDIISELVEDALCDRGIQVFVYIPSDATSRKDSQDRLLFN